MMKYMMRWMLVAAMVLGGGTAYAEKDCSTLIAGNVSDCIVRMLADNNLNVEKLPQVENLITYDTAIGLISKDKSSPVKSSLLQKMIDLRRQAILQASKPYFEQFGCGEALVLCLDRDGNLFREGAQDGERETVPELLRGDLLRIVVLSYRSDDQKKIVLAATETRESLTMFDMTLIEKPPAGDRALREAEAFTVVAGLSVKLGPDAVRITVVFKRAASETEPEMAPRSFEIDLKSRRHIVEFGLMLPFVYNRAVTPQGAVEYRWEPDLAFTITVFFKPRNSGEPIQPAGRSRFGLIVGADLTNPVREKRFYAGLDYSPINGLSVTLGAALIRWDYIPKPEDVPDILTAGVGIEPDRRYRGSFFFGVRMTPEVFNTTKAAFDALRKNLQ